VVKNKATPPKTIRVIKPVITGQWWGLGIEIEKGSRTRNLPNTLSITVLKKQKMVRANRGKKFLSWILMGIATIKPKINGTLNKFFQVSVTVNSLPHLEHFGLWIPTTDPMRAADEIVFLAQ